MYRLLIGVLVASWAGPASAGAATIRVTVHEDRAGTTAAVVFTAGPGEANRVSAAREPGGTWVLRDDGSPLTAAAGCAPIDANSARCTSPPQAATTLDVSTGDAADVVHTPVTDQVAWVDAGPGDDLVQGGGTLLGGDGRDTLEGGTLSDTLFGGPGADVLRGGDGNDTLSGDGTRDGTDGAAGDDVLDGGPGRDAASYERRQAPVDGDLALGTAGSDGEHDRLISIEALTGGAGADTLRGDDGPNGLSGNGGDDVLVGLGGDDVLSDGNGVDSLDGGDGSDQIVASNAGDRADGGPGADLLLAFGRALLDGGDGDDTLSLSDPSALVRCGAGSDTIASQVLAGTRLDGCEQVAVGGFGLLTVAVAPTGRPGGALGVPVACRAQGTSIVTGCRGGVELSLRRPGKRPLRLGRATFRLRAGQHATARLKLDPRERRALRVVAHPLFELRLAAHGTLEATYHAPGGVDARPQLNGRWRVRL